MTVRYIPTRDGEHVVDTSDHEAVCRILSIGTAELLLKRWREGAWTYASNGSGYLANCFNSWANSLSDALTYAEELRGEGEKMEREAA